MKSLSGLFGTVRQLSRASYRLRHLYKCFYSGKNRDIINKEEHRVNVYPAALAGRERFIIIIYNTHTNSEPEADLLPVPTSLFCASILPALNMLCLSDVLEEEEQNVEGGGDFKRTCGNNTLNGRFVFFHSEGYQRILICCLRIVNFRVLLNTPYLIW